MDTSEDHKSLKKKGSAHCLVGLNGPTPNSISPVLFLTVDGEPMSFFLRPGPTKRQLQPKIKAGGGLMCSSQQPGAILLMDPKDRKRFLFSRYVSTQYILDCIEKEEQLSVEDYRFNPVDVPKQDRTKAACPRLSGGVHPMSQMLAYTSDDDTAILEYVSTRKAEIGGNRLWREMEQQRVTHHSWQSMKCRYKDRLAKKQPEVVKVESTEKQEGNKRVAGDASAAPSNPQHSASKDSSLSFTQVQLEEDKQRIKELMVQTQQVVMLLYVTKALLKTSGNFSAALDLLLDPSSLSVSIWSRRDDSLLLSADPVIRQQLQEKHGEEGVAKRMVKKMFLFFPSACLSNKQMAPFLTKSLENFRIKVAL
uniref:Telomeric repeat-binding factor 2-interacting protein 1 n=1 Tax=Oryzias latipes TaxID=8090 RepID=A0A3P9I342_ORYLA